MRSSAGTKTDESTKNGFYESQLESLVVPDLFFGCKLTKLNTTESECDR